MAAASLSLTVVGAAPALAAPGPGATTIGPGVQLMTPVPGQPGEYSQCTGNFVFRSTSYTFRTVRYRTSTGAWATKRVRVAHRHTYVGMAAHCVGAANNSDSDLNGCHASVGSLPLGTTVYFYQGVSGGSSIGPIGIGNGSNGTRIGVGVLRYSSWLAMKKARTNVNSGACNYNDLSLVEVKAPYLKQVNPTVPYFGGPTTIAGLPGVGAKAYTVGNSSLRGTERSTTGTVDDHSLWEDILSQQDPGVPGDSGSGYMNARGQAVGVLSTCITSVGIATLLGTTNCPQNGIGSLAQEVAFARAHGLPNLTLVPGRVAFSAAGTGQSTAGTTSGGGLLGLGGLL